MLPCFFLKCKQLFFLMILSVSEMIFTKRTEVWHVMMMMRQIGALFSDLDGSVGFYPPTPEA